MKNIYSNIILKIPLQGMFHNYVSDWAKSEHPHSRLQHTVCYGANELPWHWQTPVWLARISVWKSL